MTTRLTIRRSIIGLNAAALCAFFRGGGLQIDETVGFMTYVNRFSALKWRQYAGLDEVCLDLVLDGSGHVRIFSVEHGSLEPVQIKQVPFFS